MLPPEVCVSFGMGVAFVPLSSTAQVGVDQKDAGVASALVDTTQQVGSSLGTALLIRASRHDVADDHGAGDGPGEEPALALSNS